VKMTMNEKINNASARVKTKRSVQVADRLWRKTMRKKINIKSSQGDSKTLYIDLLSIKCPSDQNRQEVA
jgi:hypothetical protein